MRSSQWYLIGIFLILMSSWFIRQDLNAEKVCGTPAMGLAVEEGMESLQRYELWCINTEIYDPFIWLLFPLGAVFIIGGWLESRAEKKRK